MHMNAVVIRSLTVPVAIFKLVCSKATENVNTFL